MIMVMSLSVIQDAIYKSRKIISHQLLILKYLEQYDL